ncbi:WhiB family redox-sensing transcriptional regulator [Agromyces sp. 3263]|uniref:WhiB family transcriptional regulator n=1 Tax=Agromyces sp. 3263 TaxID=2817750 RepID=UPI0028604CDD|nr:WhiB family transcriptional regulator [Agromyces sp. 3263]MDR6907499.1 WhiB family redox-sensing transcriptional regulator [Agromyces sp. 3263]
MTDLGMPGFHPWMSDAACTQVDPDMFFQTEWHDVEKARDYCKTNCNVREQCLKYAINNDIQHGVWGGETLRTRRILGKRAS